MKNPATARNHSLPFPFHRLAALMLAALVAVACAVSPKPPASSNQSGPAPGTSQTPGQTTAQQEDLFLNDWQDVDRLISEQKFQAASDRVIEIRDRARAQQDDSTLTRALLRHVQLETGLHGYETAVRLLRQQEWPQSAAHRSAVELFYAASLTNYLQGYSWEIRQRERTVSREQIDLKAWTSEQLIEEAHAAFERVWQQRDGWGDDDASETTIDIAEFLSENNYPERIRGTLRDRLTYLWADLLANSSYWTASQSNEKFKLDAQLLIEADDALRGVDLTDAAVHPLMRLAAILGDLERWHDRQGRSEAAFEARLDRLHRLIQAFGSGSSKSNQLRDALQASVESFSRDLPWWSMGMARLAEQVRSDDREDSPLVAARAIALEGANQHPESLGGQTCRAIVEQIEAPSVAVASMSNDGARRRSIELTYKNLTRLYFRAYRADLIERIESSNDYQLLYDHRAISELVANQQPVTSWREDLPETTDYQQHRAFSTPPLDQKGLYVIVAAADRGLSEGTWRAGFNFLVTDLVLLTRTVNEGAGRNQFLRREVTVRSGESGRSLEDVEVDLYRFDYQRGHARVATRTTDRFGVATFDHPAGNAQAGHQYFAIARRESAERGGADIALDPNYYYFQRAQRLFEVTSTLLYTDRSIYRPNQTLFFKVVAYSGKQIEGDYQVRAGADVVVELLDANGEVVASKTLETNSFGSASDHFQIESGRLLGNWSLRATVADSRQSYSHASIKVEEYKRPTFEVTVNDPTRSLRLNRPAELTGSVAYYFGLPVVSGKVSWRVTREPVYPWWWYWYGRPTASTQQVALGDATLDDQGQFTVSFVPEAEEPTDDAGRSVRYRYRLSVDVTDEGGETRSAQKVINLGFVAVQSSISSDTRFFLHRSKIDVEIVRTDLDGNPRPGKGRYTVFRLNQPGTTLLPAEQPLLTGARDAGLQTPGDLLRPRHGHAYQPDQVLRSWSDGRELASGELGHGDDGQASVSLSSLDPGSYRLRYQTEDEFGATNESQYEFVVARRGRTPLELPALLRVERSSVSVGDTARLLVHSGIDAQEMVLELFRDGQRTELRRLDSSDGLQLIEVPITTELRGGFGATLTLVRDHQLVRLNSSVFVPWEDRELQMSFETFRDLLRPGQEETWRVKISGSDDQTLEQGSAELLAYMYDRSLDLFGPHTPPNILSLYPHRTGIGALQSSLGMAYPGWQEGSFPGIAAAPGLYTDRLTFLDSYGIGGPGRRGQMRMQKMAMRQMPAAPMAMSEARADDAFLDSDLAASEQAVVVGSPSAEMEQDESAAQEAAEAPDIRTDFSETAFWQPHLVLDQDGGVAFEFSVPDSVTEWNVWLHSLTRDLKGASSVHQARTVKELMVRPYLPRFLREADQADITVVVNNAGETPLEGELTFDIVDPITEQSLLAEFGLDPASARRSFSVQPGGGSDLGFAIQTPARVGTVAFRVVARAGDLSDGELRPLPILPGRIHLAQSRFVTLSDQDRRELRFDELLANDDPTRINDQMVVTLDAQLFYSVLSALPYLIDYPYECTEQTLNRFLSTGILSSLFERYPSVQQMATQLAERETQYEVFDDEDPNRKMLLEESPWLRQSRGGSADQADLIKVLDPRVALAQRRASFAKLEKAQTSSGGFPWWTGGPPSPYMTLYVLDGFSRALEFQVDLPNTAQPIVQRAWSYMQRHYLDRMVRDMVNRNCCWETVTYLNYVLSNYDQAATGTGNQGPDFWTGGVFDDAQRLRMLDFSFEHWRQHSPRLKGFLALTLERAGRSEDAKLVFDSIMDSSRTEQDLGTYWAREDRSWLWYNDTIESHAFTLRAMSELEPEDARRHGLVQWLMLNKKLNHWKSTRATAEVIYSLSHYLEQEGTLASREAATVTINSQATDFEWTPDEYTGKKNQIVVPGEQVTTQTGAIVVEKETPGLLFASATWHFSTEQIPQQASSDFFGVTRRFFKRVPTASGWQLEPLAEGARLVPGDQVEVHLSLTSKHAAEYVHLRDPRGAGFEPETLRSGYKWDLGIGWYEEVRDSGTNFFFERLPVGEYTFKYRLRSTTAGTFKVAPATVQSMYAPEFVAYSSGALVTIAP